MEDNKIKRSKNLPLVSVIAGGAAGWVGNTGLDIITEMDMTHLYGISIFLGVIIGLLWDIAERLNIEKD